MGHEGAAGLTIFQSGAVLLAAAVVFVLLFRRLGLGAVLGYLIAGMLVGPHMLGLIDDPEVILEFAEIGIVLLLFLVGLELAPSRLWRLRREIFGLGFAQVALCGVAMAALIWWLSSFSLGAAIALGLPLALSSTAQVLPLLQSQGRLNSPLGERAFSILLFQDISIVPLLTIVAALSRNPSASSGPPAWQVVILAIIAVAGLVIMGRYLLSPLLHVIGLVSERELFVVAGLLAVCASAALMSWIGVSPALGAFIAGVMLADSPFRHELEADIDPFRSLLLGLFFLAVGMMLDLDVVAANPLIVIGMAALLVSVKISIITVLARLMGTPWRAAFVLGLLLSQGGEFAFVLFSEAQGALLIAPQAVSLSNAIVTLSMATTPFLMMLTRLLGGVRGQSKNSLDDPDQAENSAAIVVGHGRFGQTVSQILNASEISVTLIDIRPDQIATSQEFGRKVFFGDGTRVDILRSAGGEHAQLIFFCCDNHALTAEKLEQARTSFPNAKIFARAFDRKHLLELKSAKPDGLEREVFEAAIGLAVKGLKSRDYDGVMIDRIVEEYRSRDAGRLKAQHEAGDLKAGGHLSFGTAQSMAFRADGKSDDRDG